jgi:hypothetical protein
MYWEQEIKYYSEKKWHILPIIPEDKRPLKNYKWKENRYDYEEAHMRVCNQKTRFNLAVVLGFSGIGIIDWDYCQIPDKLQELISKTATVITPRSGRHIYYLDDCGVSKDDLVKCTKIVGGKTDMFRRGVNYCLLPLSKVLQDWQKMTSADGCYRPCNFYEWITPKEKMMKLSEIIKEILR